MTSLHHLIAGRRSGRIIDPRRSLGAEEILSLLEAARWAPSCSNNQPWRIVVSRDRSLDAVKACLSRGNAWARNAPLILTFASKPDLDCLIRGREYYPLGIGLAVENVLLQGIHLGLVMHPIAGFREAEIREALGIPEEFRIHVLVIAGHPGSEEDVDAAVLEKENALRQRKPMEDIVCWEQWGDEPSVFKA